MKLNSSIVLDFIIHSPATAAVSDADVTPTVEIFEDSNDTPILTPTAVKRTGRTGHYRVPVAATAGNGFEVGKSYNVIATATVGGVEGRGVISTFSVETRGIDDPVAVSSVSADAITASSLAADASTEIAGSVWSAGSRTLTATSDPTAAQIADAVWDEARAGHATPGTFGEGVASVQGNVAGNVDGSVDSVVDPVTVGTNQDKTNYTLTNAQHDSIVDKVWDEARAAHVTAGTFGEGAASVQGNVTGSVDSVTDPVTVGTNQDKTGYSLTGTEQDNIVNKVWDEPRASHVAPGSFGEGTASVQGNVTGSVDSVTDPVTVGTNNDKVDYTLSNVGKAAIVDLVWNEATADHQVAGSTGEALTTTSAGAGAPTVEEIRAEIDANSTVLAAIDTKTTSIETKVDTANTNISDVETLLTSVQSLVTTLLKYQKNRTKVDGIAKTLIIYDDDGITPIRTFNLRDFSGISSITEIAERIPQ